MLELPHESSQNEDGPSLVAKFPRKAVVLVLVSLEGASCSMPLAKVICDPAVEVQIVLTAAEDEAAPDAVEWRGTLLLKKPMLSGCHVVPYVECLRGSLLK